MDRPHSRRLVPTAAVVTLVALASLFLLLLVPATAGAAVRTLGTGSATFKLDPAITANLFGLAIAPYPISPASLSLGGSNVTFKMPVRGGTWNTTTEHGTFLLRGGLRYVRGMSVIIPPGILSGEFLPFAMTAWRAGVGTAAGFSIVANGTRTPTFFNQFLRGTASIVTRNGHRFVKITMLQLSFNDASSIAIKDDLGNGPNTGDPFGTATFLVRLL
jgi:hypothetical protein